MSRLPSFRFLWSTARLSVASSLLLGLAVVASAQTPNPSASQMSPGAMPTPPGSSPSPYPGSGGMGANGGAAVGLTTTGSGITRSDVSSAVRVQALLYSDVVKVGRLNLTKIDYAGLSDFVGAVVDKGVGAIQSNDDYRVKLREYQKSSIKSSFENLLKTAQSAVSQKFYKNKIDDIYFIDYEDETTIVAFPTDGLSEADQKTLIDAVADEAKPFAIFNRYGFVVAVVEHPNGKKADVAALQAKYRLRASALNAAQQNAGFGGATSQFGSGLNGSGAAQGNELGLPDAVFAEYQAELKSAEKAQADSRKEVLPFVRRRFSNPATAEEAAKFADALKQTDGAAFTFVAAEIAELSKMATLAGSGAQTDATPSAELLADSFSEDGDDVVFDSNDAAADSPSFGAGVFKSLLAESNDANGLQTTAFAVSLVGSPRFVAILAFDKPESATAGAANIEKALATAKPFATAWAASLAQNENAENLDLSPLVDGIFDGLKPQVVGSKVATTLDLNVLKEQADVLLPLFGGVEAKSAAEMEADSIDWNLGATDDATATEEDETVDATEETKEGIDATEEDDPFADETETTTETEEESDPFGEDDPFN